jgi:nitrogen fixation/metabolism regulation signal transduction histidine kinase
MTYKHFNKAIFLRLAIIILLSMAISYLIFVEKDYALCLLPIFLLVITLFNIVMYFNKINQWIAFFLLGIENEDSTLKAPTKSGNKAIDDIYFGINRLNEIFQQTKIEISTQDQYFQSVINQSATGLFSINESGRVVNINPAATKLTALHDHHHVNVLMEIDAALPHFLINPIKNIQQQSAIFENKYGQKLFFKQSEIINQKEKIRLVAVSDITKELDNGEVDAWIKLARTLSHEIMNNIAPITTLSQVISNYFSKDNKTVEISDLEPKTISNTVKGLKVIEERSIGLMSFVENYRKFTKLPAPKFAKVDLTQIVENNLMAASTYFGFENIKLEKQLPEKCMISTDEKLLSQVIINLLKNACEALQLGNTKFPELKVKLLKSENIVKLEISNNGPDIPAEIREQIFIPFYTTKEEGSGVGLSLSKQIMLKMNGDILLKTTQNNLTSFIVVLT